MKKALSFIIRYKWTFIILPIVVILIVTTAMIYSLPDREIKMLADEDVGYCTNAQQLIDEVSPENLPNVVMSISKQLTASNNNILVSRRLDATGDAEYLEPIETEKYYIDLKTPVASAKCVDVYAIGKIKGKQVKLLLNSAFKIDVREIDNVIHIVRTSQKIEVFRFADNVYYDMSKIAIQYYIRIS